ncbi:hypothetical protein [Haloparvum sp. PAK95]|uniref:hypothetical protein n=1 Tax=Haloparvum sp. PAK95 TaxID=3418962 RepID=UPI003D2EF339
MTKPRASASISWALHLPSLSRLGAPRGKERGDSSTRDSVADLDDKLGGAQTERDELADPDELPESAAAAGEVFKAEGKYWVVGKGEYAFDPNSPT